MINLFLKDLKLLLTRKGNPSRQVLSYLVFAMFAGLFIFLETEIFNRLFIKFEPFEGAPTAFLSLFLTILSVLFILNDISVSCRLFFDKRDQEVLNSRPIPDFEIVLSKLLLLFVVNLGFGLLFIYPILISYGIQASKTPNYYWLTLFYTAISFFLESGIALLLAYPYFLFKSFLDVHPVIRLLVILIVMGAISYGYLSILDLFLNLIGGTLSNTFFSTTNIERLISWRKYEMPASYLVGVFVEKRVKDLFFVLFLGFGIFLIGLSVAFLGYRKTRMLRLNYTSEKHHTYKKHSVLSSLIRKELLLLFRGSDSMMSFIGLLMIQPVLMDFVIRSINTSLLSATFSYLTLLFPYFAFYLDLFMIILFVNCINSGSSDYFQRERKGILLMKTIPASFETQLVLKMLIPFLCSDLFLLVSLILMAGLNIMPFLDCVYFFILATLSLLAYDFSNLMDEVKGRKEGTKVPSSLMLYLLPFLLLAFDLILSFFKLGRGYVVLINACILLCIDITFFFVLKKNMVSWFYHSERLA